MSIINEVIASSDKIHIDEDYGTETYLRIVHTTTLLALRRAVREANPGRIPIYSPYDCTGLVCCQTCKIIKIYKTSVGYSSVVEMCVTRDV